MTIGISLKIDVTKLDKSRFYKGNKGTYADLTVFIDTDKPDEYGNHGGISESLSKEEREGGAKPHYVGNAKVFYNPVSSGQSSSAQSIQEDDFESDSIPF